MNSTKYIPHRLAKLFQLEPEIAEQVWRFGSIYFTELLLLWIVTSGGSENKNLNFNLIKIGDLQINVMLLQTIGFLAGAFYFGYKGESKERKKINRIRNLKNSLKYYWIGAFLSFFFFTTTEIIGFNLQYADWLFALSRAITCFGISGGIGINLTIIALSVKNGNHSVPILLFTVLGVLGTVLCCIMLYFIKEPYNVASVLFIGTLFGFFQWYKLNQYNLKVDYTNLYSFKITKDAFWTRIASFLTIGLPTFYLAGILASHADIIIKQWFPDKIFLNPSALFLGIQYLGFAIICIIFSLPDTRLVPFRGLITTYRKYLLRIGTFFQLVFIIPFLFIEEKLPSFLYFIFILSSGIGIGINWGVLMILIFEQEEFKNAKTFAATIIPNIIRSTFALILLLPVLLGTKTCFDGNNQIGELRMLGYLVYIPYAIAIAIFKDKGERKNRYRLEEPGLKEAIDSIITSQKTYSISQEKNNDFLLYDFLNSLKEKVLSALHKFEFKPDLISFHYTFANGQIQGTKFNDEELKNERVILVKNIISGQGSGKVTNLLSLLANSDSENKLKLSCILIYASKEDLNDICEEEEGIVSFDLNNKSKAYKSKSELADEVEKRFSLSLTVDQKVAIEHNFGSHIDASKKEGGKDYFLYIIRPDEDIKDISMYLVLLKSYHIKNETIASYQTLLDLILFKQSKFKLNSLEKEKLELEKNLSKVKNEKQEVADMLKTKESDNKRFQSNTLKELIAKNQVEIVLNKMLEFAKIQNDLDLENIIIKLLYDWYEIHKKELLGTVDSQDQLRKNKIPVNLLEIIDRNFGSAYEK